MIRLTDHLDMTIVVDWDEKNTNQTKQKFKLLTFFEMTPIFRGVSARNFAEKLRESSPREKKKWSARTYAKFRESSRLRIFVRRSMRVWIGGSSISVVNKILGN